MLEAPTEDSLTHEEAIMPLCTKKLFLQQRRTRMPLHQRRGRGRGLDSLNDLPGPTPQNRDHNDCNSKITSTNPKWMALSTTESHENARISPGWKPRMLACWKRSNRCGSSLPVGSCVLSLDWVDASKVGKQEAATLFSWWSWRTKWDVLRCLYKLREATLIEGTSCLSSC